MLRLGAALVAIVCWAGLAIQFSVTFGEVKAIGPALWILARFFTILTNLAVAVVMTAEALGRRVSPLVLGGGTLAILLVGIVYVTLLEGLHVLAGPALVADTLMHKVSPVLMALWWLLFAPHRRLRWSAAWTFAAYPLAYFVYVLARGHVDGRYPYPFIDVSKLGWTQAALNAGGIALAFILAGFALVALDRILPGAAKARR